MYPGSWGNTSQGDETQALKFKQIDSLRQYFPTVKEITREQLYEVPLSLPSRRMITVRITLPRDFPRVSPQLQVFPPVQHRLIDGQMMVIPQAHENLLRWGNQSSLGKTVYEIVQKFMQDPPQIIPQNVPVSPNSVQVNNNPNIQPPQVVPPQFSNQGPSFSGGQIPVQTKTHTPLPVVPGSFSELDAKSPSELALLLNDENEFKRFFDHLSAVQTMKKVRDDLRTNNDELAKKNLSKEAELDKIKRELSARQQLIAEKRLAFDQKAKQQQEVMKQFSTPALVDHLTVAAAEAEGSSDAIANQFLSGELDQKNFVKEFMEKRKLYHLRAAKKESLLMLTR